MTTALIVWGAGALLNALVVLYLKEELNSNNIRRRIYPSLCLMMILSSFISWIVVLGVLIFDYSISNNKITDDRKEEDFSEEIK